MNKFKRELITELVEVVNPLTGESRQFRQFPPSGYTGIPNIVHSLSNSSLNAQANKKPKQILQSEIMADFEINRKINKEVCIKMFHNCPSSGFRLMEPSGIRMYGSWNVLSIAAPQDLSKFSKPTLPKKRILPPENKEEQSFNEKIANFNKLFHKE